MAERSDAEAHEHRQIGRPKNRTDCNPNQHMSKILYCPYSRIIIVKLEGSSQLVSLLLFIVRGTWVV